MGFDLQSWKDQVYERLVALRLRWEQAKPQAVYAGLCAAALWPLAQAAQGDGFASTVMALARVAAGVGGNLIAEQMQRWRDEGDTPSEVVVEDWIKAQIASNADVRAALDAIVEHVEAIPQVQAGLNQADRQWFTQTLRQELTAMDNLARFEAHLTGSGAVAQGQDNVVAGERAVAIGGDVNESTIITDSHNILGNVYHGPPTRDPAEALSIYRRVLAATYRHLPLRGIDIGASDPTQSQQSLNLARVYVDLHTTTQVLRPDPIRSHEGAVRTRGERPGEEREMPLGALEAAVNHRHVVLLGDPGSGKSTFVSHLALCLAAHILEPQAGWLTHLPQWPSQEEDLVPIFVVLRDFARSLPQRARKGEPRYLWNFIKTRLKAQNLTFAAEPLQEKLDQGRAILLLDGLDEIPTLAQRALICDTIVACAARYAGCRIIVTCRTLSYQDVAWQLADFPSFTLARSMTRRSSSSSTPGMPNWPDSAR